MIRLIDFRILRVLLAFSILCIVLSAQVALADIAEEQESQTDGETSQDADEGNNPYGDSYLDSEIDAIRMALYAANMDFTDMTFNKHYAKGYECLPIVLEMMHDPMLIAPTMDAYATSVMEAEDEILSPFRELISCLYFLPEKSEIIKNLEIICKKGLDGTGLADYDELIVALEAILATELEMPFSEIELKTLREKLPYQMAWHDVFESPFDDATRAEIEAAIEDAPDKYLYELASRMDLTATLEAFFRMSVIDIEALSNSKFDSFPADEPLIVDTEHGRICLGTLGDDYYEGDFALMIEPGGNDVYRNCRIGAAFGAPADGLGDGRIGLFVDFSGDDFYDCGETNITLGAAVLGVAAFYDLGSGNDRYVAGSLTLGAAVAGIATFYDDGGSDSYEGKVFTEGAAGFGIGLMIDDSVNPAPDFPTDVETPDPIRIEVFDNDRYHAWTNSQAFARTRGIAICQNKRGNEIYEAGGVYLHAPLFADRYQSFSQGFAIGERGIDYAGGIAFIIDFDGNDRYLGDIYNQGVGYWYSAGLLWDGGGNDSYEMTQYGQGSGIHLAIGGLVDVGGNDTYVMHSGLGQGGSHDFAASILHDRGGNDHYMGMTSCNGSGLTNSVGIHIDRSGNDTYAGRRNSGVNFGRPARGFSSIGILVDLAGADDYLGIMNDGDFWRHTEIGVGWDIAPPSAPEPEAAPAAAEPAEIPVEIPEICFYEGELNQEVFDELWEISIRWEVGDNRYIVPEARQRLVDFGAAALPYMSEEMDNSASSLAFRAYDFIFRALIEKGARAEVIAVVLENAESDNETRRRIALYLIGSQKLTELEDVVVGFLESDDDSMMRRAIGVIAQLESHTADEMLIGFISPDEDEMKIRAAMTTLMSLEADCYDSMRPLLDHPLMSIRDSLTRLLAAHWEMYGARARADIAYAAQVQIAGVANNEVDRTDSALSSRALRTLLDTLTRVSEPPDAELADAVASLLDSDDWGMRADAARVIRYWQTLPGTDWEVLKPVLAKLREMLTNEDEPYVKFAGEQK